VVGPNGIGHLSSVKAIASGSYSNLALENDGTVWAWGFDREGELGNATFTSSAVPIQVGAVGPSISLLSSYSATTGGAGFTLTVNGFNFGAGATVQWNGQGRPTTYVSSHQLTAQIPATDIENPGWMGVTVQNPDGTISYPAAFIVSGTPNSVAGAVGLEQAVNLQQTLTFELHEIGGAIITVPVTLAADGSYTITGLPTGQYNIGVKGAKWLRTTLTNVTVSGQISNLNPNLVAGDINGDNVIDISDFALLAAAFGSDPTTANWNTNADLNCDGVVDLLDFDIFAGNFGLTGDPAP
jgi:hypothetical protein